MPEPEGGQWYTNRDLFEQIQALGHTMDGLQTQMQLTQNELKATRDDMRKYNELRGQIASCQKDILTLQQQAIGRASVGKGFRDWGGWAFGIIGTIVGVAGLILALRRG